LTIVKLNEDRISRVGEALKALGLESALKVEELDPQFQAAKLIVNKMGFGPALTLVALNSLISYRLGGRGEDYWSEFALFISKVSEPKNLRDAVKLVISFLSSSRINITLRRSKVSRLLRASVINVLEPWTIVKYVKSRNLRNLARSMASSLKTKWTSKTVVFAIKMLCYAYRAYKGKPLIAPFNIPIPMDSRIAKLSWTSGIVDVIDEEPLSWSKVVKAITSKPSLTQRAWSRVAKICGIPPIHLDSILWLIGGFLDRKASREKVIENATNSLARMTLRNFNDVKRVVEEVINRYLSR